jgi:hypothetical protein
VASRLRFNAVPAALLLHAFSPLRYWENVFSISCLNRNSEIDAESVEALNAGREDCHREAASLLEKRPISKLCDELGLQPTVFYHRQKEFSENRAAASSRNGQPTPPLNSSGSHTWRRRSGQTKLGALTCCNGYGKHLRLWMPSSGRLVCPRTPR